MILTTILGSNAIILLAMLIFCIFGLRKLRKLDHLLTSEEANRLFTTKLTPFNDMIQDHNFGILNHHSPFATTRRGPPRMSSFVTSPELVVPLPRPRPLGSMTNPRARQPARDRRSMEEIELDDLAPEDRDIPSIMVPNEPKKKSRISQFGSRTKSNLAKLTSFRSK